LVLRTKELLDSIPTFLKRCREWGITVTILPTAFWHELTAQVAEENLTFPEGLRLVYFGGDRTLPERLGTWRARVSDRTRLVNGYGPSEATMVSTMCSLTEMAEPPAALWTVPIGRPINNARIYILDRHLTPVPIGVPGELYIGGVGVARGYLNRPALTATSFTPDPFGQESGTRLYKSGDLARYLADGKIEFLGRLDLQVKVRGFRVELSEIETVLAGHPAVRQAAVIARGNGLAGSSARPADKRLFAYVVPTIETGGTVNELRRYLSERVPDYMIPSAFVVLDRLPLTPNGKVDRRALPSPNLGRPELEEAYVAPRTPVEDALSRIWQEVLGLSQVGVHDDFFGLGGHSLLAARVLSGVRSRLGVDLPVRELFEAPTIAGLARSVEIMRCSMFSPRNRTREVEGQREEASL
jgi:acyl-CoA synthetase (AMP-forming)/AMP-acid ligase II